MWAFQCVVKSKHLLPVKIPLIFLNKISHVTKKEATVKIHCNNDILHGPFRRTS